MSAPCMNGGLCVDVLNGFECQCLPGYLGKHDSENKTQIVLKKSNVTYIFIGDTCDVDLAVCNTTNEIRCHNGGICLEGPGLSFNCNCSSGLASNNYANYPNLKVLII